MIEKIDINELGWGKIGVGGTSINHFEPSLACAQLAKKINELIEERNQAYEKGREDERKELIANR